MRPSLIMGISVIVFQIQWWLCIFSGIYQHAQYAYWVAFALFLINFQGALIPVWLMILWACFSAWFLHAQWLNQRLIVILCLFSICGTGSYYCAARLHALTFLMPLNYSLMIMALDWFCLGVLFFIIVRCRCIKRFLG